MATFSIKLDKRTLLKDNKYNLVIRIFDRDKFLDLRIQRININHYNKVFKRHAIDEKSIKIRETCNELLCRSEKIFHSIGWLDKEKIRERFYNDQTPKTHSIKDLFEYYRVTTNNRLSTYERMNSGINSLCTYKPNLSLLEVTTDLLNNYERHLINKSVSLATVASYMKDLRVVINHCKNNLEDFPETYNVPFGSHGYSIKSNFGLKKVMGFEELDLVLNFKDFKSEFDEFALDIWKLLFYSNGINFIDALILKWENIHSDVIRIMRRKTLTTRKNNIKAIQIPIDSQIDRIIKRWGVKNNKYVLGLIDNEFNEKHLYSRNKLYRRKINSSLKSISNQLNLSVPLRIKTARETYATSLFRLGAPKDQIGEMMGHSNSKVTEHYFGSLGVEIVSEINKISLDQRNDFLQGLLQGCCVK